MTFFKRRSSSPNEQLLPYTITARDLRILPNKFGLIFFLVLFAILLSSINDNNNLGYMLAFLLLSMLVSSIFYTYRNLLGITISSLQSKPVFAGENLQFICTIDPKNLDRNLIEIGFNNQQNNFLPILKNNKLDTKLLHSTQQRGILKPNRLTLSSSFPFGLFTAKATLNLESVAIVYPKPQPTNLPETYFLEPGIYSERQVANTSGNEDFSGLKTYQAGDSLKQIFWKAAAKGQGLMTKTFSGSSSQILLLDYQTIKGDKEQRLSLICDMVLQANRKQLAFALKLPNKELPASSGEVHFYQCLEALALC
jgi:uncharacterized protein (DUF58 family)